LIRLSAIFVVLYVFILLLNGCSDDPASIGRDLLKDDRINILEKDSFTDSLNQSSSYFKRVVPLRDANTLLIGKKANVESSLLLKFFLALTDTLANDLLNDRINVLSAKVLLAQTYTFGDSTAPFDFSVHNIISSWSDSSFTADSLPLLQFDPADAASNINFISGDTLEFDLNIQNVLTWLKVRADTNIADDNGIFIKPSDNAQKIAGFSIIPELIIFIEKPGVYQDSLTFGPSSEINAVTGSVPAVSSENIVVQNSVLFESKLWFDLSSIPKTALINYAELTLTLDTNETITGSAYTGYIRAFFLTDSLNNSIDSINLASITRSGNLYKGDITHYVQNWVNGTDNQGMLLTPVMTGEGVELLSFKGSSSADLSVRPRLKIVYTTKR